VSEGPDAPPYMLPRQWPALARRWAVFNGDRTAVSAPALGGLQDGVDAPSWHYAPWPGAISRARWPWSGPGIASMRRVYRLWQLRTVPSVWLSWGRPGVGQELQRVVICRDGVRRQNGTRQQCPAARSSPGRVLRGEPCRHDVRVRADRQVALIAQRGRSADGNRARTRRSARLAGTRRCHT
jgi:hypothetical protein